LNPSGLNARDFFDTTNGNAATPLRSASGQSVIIAPFSAARFVPFPGNSGFGQFTATNSQPLTVRNGSGGKDDSRLLQGGFVLGGPLAPNKMFYFVSVEGQDLRATREANFVVPTLEQRGAFGTGASGAFRDPL